MIPYIPNICKIHYVNMQVTPCNTFSDAATTPDQCHDDPTANCKIITLIGGCTNTDLKVRKVMLNTCPRTCNLCSEYYSLCADNTDSNCDLLHAAGICDSSDPSVKDRMRRKCPRTCNMCSEVIGEFS